MSKRSGRSHPVELDDRENDAAGEQGHSKYTKNKDAAITHFKAFLRSAILIYMPMPMMDGTHSPTNWPASL